MMHSFSFGQPEESIIQMAYVVPSLHEAIGRWILQLGVGPWFVAEHFKGLAPRFRGQPAAADVSIGMAYAGNMCIELVQQHDEYPSVFKDVTSKHGFGFHHWGIGTRHFDQRFAEQKIQGKELLFTDQVPGGGRIAYFDSTDTLPGMIELIEITPVGEALFKRFQDASADWDRSNPLRSF